MLTSPIKLTRRICPITCLEKTIKRCAECGSQALREICRSNEEEGACSKDGRPICKIPEESVDTCSPTPKVVVVGAGMAGLSAAVRLVEFGIKDVTIIEATDRPGGRVHSCWLGNAVVELGAQLIEGGCAANPIYSLASQEGLLHPAPLRHSKTFAAHQSSSGYPVSKLVVKTAPFSYRRIREEAEDVFHEFCEMPEDESLRDFMWDRIKEEIPIYDCDHRVDASLVLYSMTNFLRNRIGSDLTKVSTNQFGCKVDIPMGRVKVPTGLIGVLAPLIRALPDCAIKYCKPVSKIMWGEGQEAKDGRVRILCCDGDIFCCDYAIVTPSLGVLKKQHHEMFSPPLPEYKKTAIEKLGYGHQTHVYMMYDKPFWLKGRGNLRLCWSLGELKERGEWIRGAPCITEDSLGVLSITVSDTEASCVENLSDVRIAEDVTTVFRKFLKNPTIRYPQCVVKSMWSQSPYYLGAKSYIPVGETNAQQCALGSPLPQQCGTLYPKLLFAGEATAIGHHGTLHGARISGIREAQRIIDYTIKLRGIPQDKPCIALPCN